MQDIVADVRSVWENGFLKKCKGRGFGKSLSARAGVGMENN